MGQHRIHWRTVLLQPLQQMLRVAETAGAVGVGLHQLHLTAAVAHIVLSQQKPVIQRKPAGAIPGVHLPELFQTLCQQRSQHMGSGHVTLVAAHFTGQTGHEQIGHSVFHSSVENLRHRQFSLQPAHHLGFPAGSLVIGGDFEHHVVKHQYACARKPGGIAGVGLSTDSILNDLGKRVHPFHRHQKGLLFAFSAKSLWSSM